ncbi:MAG: hypothetical protein PVH89_04785 [Gammaproteobacteria bacterium]
MLVTLSLATVTILGIIVGALSLWGIAQPAKLIRFVQTVMEQRSGVYVAVFVRLLLGAALIICASVSRFPTTFMVLGWIAVIAALGLALIGPQGMRRVVGWFDRFPPLFVRLWLLLGLGFAGFLVYGALAST